MSKVVHAAVRTATHVRRGKGPEGRAQAAVGGGDGEWGSIKFPDLACRVSRRRYGASPPRHAAAPAAAAGRRASVPHRGNRECRSDRPAWPASSRVPHTAPCSPAYRRAPTQECRSEEHTYELQLLTSISE